MRSFLRRENSEKRIRKCSYCGEVTEVEFLIKKSEDGLIKPLYVCKFCEMAEEL